MAGAYVEGQDGDAAKYQQIERFPISHSLAHALFVFDNYFGRLILTMWTLLF
jgi:hypothetical protein